MPTKLTNLQLKEVSLVDKGASPHAHIRMFKRHHIDLIRNEFPNLCRGLSDAEVARNLDGQMAKEAKPLPADGLTEAERKRRLESKNGKGEAARHPTASPVSSASDSMTKTATASAPLTRSGVQVLFDHGVAEVAKRDGVDKLTATRRFIDSDEGRKIFRALDDKSIPEGPAPTPFTPSVVSESVAKSRAVVDRPALAQMTTLAKSFKETEAKAGRQITDAKAFAVAMDAHPAVAAAVMNEERAGLAARR